MIKFCGLLFLLLVLLSQKFEVKAIYDPLSVSNNSFGVHILEIAELEKATQFVNSRGGDWGYVTIPIRANDRDLSRWSKFMEDCKRLHLIPILRIATFPSGEFWTAPNEKDLIDFANFLNDLPWPTRNRYVVIYNEPNHRNEWGGYVNPSEYVSILFQAIDIFHRKNEDFFVISAGMDASAPNGANSMNEYDYMRIMNSIVPGIFNMVDGIAVHSYGNPGFKSAPNFYNSVSVGSFRYEINFLTTLGVFSPKIFITEAGWRNDLVGQEYAASYYLTAYNSYWNDTKIVAVTPFVLSASSGPFEGFSFLDQNGNFLDFVKPILELPKVSGSPSLSIPFKIDEIVSDGKIVEENRNLNFDDNLLSKILRLIKFIRL